MATEEQIKELAYFIWEKEGHPEGKDQEHYSRAQKILEEQEKVHIRVTDLVKQDDLDQQLKDAAQLLGEERQKAIRQLVEEHLVAIKLVVEEERKEISTKAASLRKSMSNVGL